MKKVIIGFVAGVVCATAGTAAASTAIQKITASVRSDFNVELDGVKVDLKNDPLAYNGSSYLPVKEISELLGKEVNFKDGVIQITTPVKKITNVSEMSLSRVEIEIKMTRNAIDLADWDIKTSAAKGEDTTEMEAKKAEFEQRLAELEARKAELEARESAE